MSHINLFRSNFVVEVSEMSKLQALPLLRCLVLAECPVSETDDYRLEVLVALPKLERLDKDEFTEDERSDAEEVRRGGREKGGAGE